MATRVFRSNPGEPSTAVSEAVGAATTKLVEVTVDLSTTGIGGNRAITREEALQCLERIEDYVQKANWPPA